MKTKPKARVMWANYYPVGCASAVVHATKARAEEGAAGCVEPVRVAVIPLCDVDGIVDEAANAYAEYSGLPAYESPIRAALTAAGIPCLNRKARK